MISKATIFLRLIDNRCTFASCNRSIKSIYWYIHVDTYVHYTNTSICFQYLIVVVLSEISYFKSLKVYSFVKKKKKKNSHQ